MTSWTTNPFPVAPWDAPGLPPRTLAERCARHKHCAYRDDQPGLCPVCHATTAKCGGEHGGAPVPGWERGIAGKTSGTLKAGQYKDPRKALQSKVTGAQPAEPAVEQVSFTFRTTTARERVPA